MRRFISPIFFAALAFGGELADLSNECKKGNDEICKRLSAALKNLELACDEGGEKNAMSCAGLGYFYEFRAILRQGLQAGRGQGLRVSGAALSKRTRRSARS